ncbi:hypothetical protein V8E36_004779 [Tilletia maclaganii]
MSGPSPASPPPVRTTISRGPRGPQDFKYGQILGEGSYSTVVEAWDLLSDPRSAAQAQAQNLSVSPSYSSVGNRSRASSTASIGAAVAAAAAGLSSPAPPSNQYGRSPDSSTASAIVAGNSTIDTTGKKVYAIKILHKAHIVKEKKHKYVGIEKEALSRLTRAPGIITLYWTFQDRESLYFVLALAPNGELLSHIKTLGSFSVPTTRFYGAQLLEAIRSIHEAGVIHRDIKPENVLFDKEMRIKITDFGSAKILTANPAASALTAPSAGPTQPNAPLPQQTSVATAVIPASPRARPALVRSADSNAQSHPSGAGGAGDGVTEKPSSFVGTAEYVSPELLLSRSVSFASDWWAFGCIVFQMLCGRPPFKGPTEYQTFQRILHRDLEWPEFFEAERQGLADARALIEQLLVLAPEERLGYVAIEAEDEDGSPPSPVKETTKTLRAANSGARAIRSAKFFEGVPWDSLWIQPVPDLEAGKVAPRMPLSTPMSQLEYEFGDAAFFEEDIEEEEDDDEVEDDEHKNAGKGIGNGNATAREA